jgi:hypothetical protein
MERPPPWATEAAPAQIPRQEDKSRDSRTVVSGEGTSATRESKNFRATHPSNDSARIRLVRITLRGERYANLRLLSLTGTELTPSPHWTGPKSVRLFADHCFCATGFGRDHGDGSQGMTAAPPRFLSLTELNLDAAEILRPMSLLRLNTRPRACDLKRAVCGVEGNRCRTCERCSRTHAA